MGFLGFIWNFNKWGINLRRNDGGFCCDISFIILFRNFVLVDVFCCILVLFEKVRVFFLIFFIVFGCCVVNCILYFCKFWVFSFVINLFLWYVWRFILLILRMIDYFFYLFFVCIDYEMIILNGVLFWWLWWFWLRVRVMEMI